MLGWLVAGAVLFGFPRESKPGAADAVVVLAGARGPRLQRGLELVRDRVAPVLVISDGWDPLWPEANRLCAGRPVRFRVLCFRPRPYSTQGEARAVARLIHALGWESVVVVTSRYHVTRARMLVERCTERRIDAVGADYPLREVPWVLGAETLKLGYALTLERGC